MIPGLFQLLGRKGFQQGADKGGHPANYSYQSVPTQTTWTFTGDIVNNFNVAVSTAVLATTPNNLMVFYVQQW